MDAITIISMITISITTTLFIYFILKVNKLRKEFKVLLNIVGGLKFRVFEHEAQLLGRKGMYIPEDAAEFVFNVVWSMISDKQKSELEKEYKENCPSHIPLWKYVLYNYRIDTKLIPKEPFMRIDSPQDILLDNIGQTIEQTIKKIEKIEKKLDTIRLDNTDKTEKG